MTCGYCPNRSMERKRQFIEDSVWETILHKYIVPYRFHNQFCPPTAIFHKDGESLLDKKLPGRLRSLADLCPDMKIDIYSNGVLLPSWRNRGRDFMTFLASLPNKVRYMMSYHPFNHDGSINDYCEVTDYLRGILRSPPPNVEFITVSHKSKWVTERMQENWREEWRGLPITVHCNCAINPWTGRIEEGTVKFNGCPYGDFGHWFIGVTGNVIACCLDLEEEIILGNVMTHTPEDMFTKTSEFYQQQRYTQENKIRPLHPVCDNCYGYDRSDRSPVLLQLGLPS